MLPTSQNPDISNQKPCPYCGEKMFIQSWRYCNKESCRLAHGYKRYLAKKAEKELAREGKKLESEVLSTNNH